MRFDIIKKEMPIDQFFIENILCQEGIKIDSVLKGKTYWVESQNSQSDLHYTKNLLRDKVDEVVLFDEVKSTELSYDFLVEVSFKPGVTDNRAKVTTEAINKHLGRTDTKVASGDLYFIKAGICHEKLVKIASSHFYNPLIQRVQIFKAFETTNFIPSPRFPQVSMTTSIVKTYNLNICDESLMQLSEVNLWALSLHELHHVKDYYNSPVTIENRKRQSLPKDPTDIEIEIIAQSWSEHCKHKIFSSTITYTESEETKNKIGNKEIKGIFPDYIKKSTKDVAEKFNIDWLISLFSDNAGIVRFDKEIDFAFKVETHNSPSALDPYGGSLTGILGVNRDILGVGMGALPIANTDVLCFAPSKYPKEILSALPRKLKHPLSILQGVHRGIEDGGNKSGIPTVNGAIHFHDNYAGKPLVYCGTVGVIPQEIKGKKSSEKFYEAGDLIVVCGGSVGADGIHGATFSSLEMDDNAPSTAVQIGDPFTQKRLTDFLIQARDELLFSGLTDNGAGGLSSSVGEMAEKTNGALINLETIPLKYPGLSPYEIIISESQERMTFAVPIEKINEFMALAKKRQVNPAIIGEFHNRGSFEIKEHGKLLSSLTLEFLHESLKPMELKAHFDGSKPDTPWHKQLPKRESLSLNDSIKLLLQDDNIKSKESLIRQFDHEVKASTIVKPFITNEHSSPSDAAVIWTHLYGGSENGAIVISNGLCPQLSHIDTYYMTQMAMDEAVRNAVSTGANPSFISLCDNFCWPDPIESSKNPDAKHKLAQLVRSSQALYDTAMIYGTPFISGKDSMKNDFIGETPDGDSLKISVPPTLLISALAKMDSVEDFMTSDFKKAGDSIYLIGVENFKQLYFSTFDKTLLEHAPINMEMNKEVFHSIHELIKAKLISSCHDISEGGVIIALIESSFAQNIGIELHENIIKENENLNAFFFNELSGNFIISVPAEKEEAFLDKSKNTPYRKLGKTTTGKNITYKDKINLDITDLFNTWSSHEY